MDLGQDYLMTATLVQDAKWGYQYNASDVHLNYDLSQEEDQRKFLSYFLSEIQIDALFAAFSNPVELLDQRQIAQLQTIKGIGPVKALKMCTRYEECKNTGRAYVVFGDLGLTKNAIDKIVKQYGSVDIAVDAVTANPYILIKDVRGYGWDKADAIAQKKGFLPDSKERVQAYAQYYLQEQADVNGNSCVPIDDLIINVCTMCYPISKETASSYIKEITANDRQFDEYMEKHVQTHKEDDHPLLYYNLETRKVGLFWYRVVERDIYLEMLRIRNAEASFTFPKDVCEQAIAECEKEQGFEYTDEQKSAIWMILNNNLTIITGSAGTGKSHTLKPLIRILQKMNLKVEQCALAGRASSLLSSVTGLEGKTIHRLLHYQAEINRFKHNYENPIPADVVILDETSMVGEELFLALLSSIPTGSKFIMLGDIKQLPPLAVGNILSDSLQSGYVKTTILTKIHRQATRSGITAQAIRISAGESIIKNNFLGSEIRGELEDFKITSASDAAIIHYNIIEEFKRLYNVEKIPADSIQVIVPMRMKGDTSCRSLNEEIQEIVNPGQEENTVQVVFTENGSKYIIKFKPKDRIIINRNNYHAIGVDGKEHAVFNGNLGHIKEITEDVMIVTIDGEDGDLMFTRDDWYNINLAYAITVHKLQGSQAPYTIVGLDYSAYALLSRELVYTALTRATKYCSMVAQPKALNMATHTSSIKTKITWLKDDLIKAIVAEEVGDF